MLVKHRHINTQSDRCYRMPCHDQAYKGYTLLYYRYYSHYVIKLITPDKRKLDVELIEDNEFYADYMQQVKSYIDLLIKKEVYHEH